jgi:hypothetical protein
VGLYCVLLVDLSRERDRESEEKRMECKEFESELLGRRLGASLETTRGDEQQTTSLYNSMYKEVYKHHLAVSMSTRTSTTAKSTPKSKSTAPPAIELRKQLSQISVRHMNTAPRGIIHSILILAQIISLTPLWVRENSISFHHKLEFFFVSALWCNLSKTATFGVRCLPCLDGASSFPVCKPS